MTVVYRKLLIIHKTNIKYFKYFYYNGNNYFGFLTILKFKSYEFELQPREVLLFIY